MKQKIQNSRYSNKNYNRRQYRGWLYGSRTDALEKISNKTLRAMDDVMLDYNFRGRMAHGNWRRNSYLNKQPHEFFHWWYRPNVVVNFPDPDPDP